VLVNVSSGAALSPQPGLGLYCATKAAVQMLTEVIEQEEGRTGLRAFTVEPEQSTPTCWRLSVPRRRSGSRTRRSRDVHGSGEAYSRVRRRDRVATLAFGSAAD
jgi:NAD(P)-dependent dehydrogenase (short-subunit alcohol dehydrogenase family)